MGRCQQARRSYNFDETLNFLFDWDGEDQGNKLDDSDTPSSERENEEDNLMVNMLPLNKTYEEPTPLLQDRQKKKKKTDKGSNKFIGDSF